jgi:chromosome segregation ATPase
LRIILLGKEEIMAEVGLELLGTLIRRLDDKIDRVREDIADRKTDMEVTAALVRRLDSSVQGLTGEVRALRSQQDRQRRRPVRHEARLQALEEPREPV